MSTNAPEQKSVIYAPIGYKMNIKRAMVNSLKLVFNQNHPDTTMKNLFISMEWAERPQQYPAMLVSYAERKLVNAGLGHTELSRNNAIMKRWMYEGTISVVMFSHTTLQLDFISDQFVNMFAFGGLEELSSVFKRYFEENLGLEIQVASDVLAPLGDSAQKGASWGVEDVTLFSCGYTFDVLGTFHSPDKTFGFVRRVFENAVISNR